MPTFFVTIWFCIWFCKSVQWWSLSIANVLCRWNYLKCHVNIQNNRHWLADNPHTLVTHLKKSPVSTGNLYRQEHQFLITCSESVKHVWHVREIISKIRVYSISRFCSDAHPYYYRATKQPKQHTQTSLSLFVLNHISLKNAENEWVRF